MFTNETASAFQDGGLYLGRSGTRAIGVVTEKHAVCIAGSGAGKGVALIVPNLLRWRSSCLVIDTKGEALERTHAERSAMGQKVVALDPFRVAEVPDGIRGAFNPLALIEPDGWAAREALQAISDGLVKVHDPRHMEWTEGARDILAGVMAFIVDTATPENKNLTSIRSILLRTDDELREIALDMIECTACGGLAKAAGTAILTGLDSSKAIERDFLSGARRSTKWLDSPQIADCLKSSSFDLADLKGGGLSVFVVLPPHLLDTHAAFLRLFVRAALHAMAMGGNNKGGRCLFVLDEVFSLGKLDELTVAAGLMRSYGVNLFLFFQDLGQGVALYGPQGMQTFFANSDAHIFFGCQDPDTINHISARLGVVTAAEIGPPPVHVPSRPSSGQGIAALMGGGRNQQAGQVAGAMWAGLSNFGASISDAIAADAMAKYQHKAQTLGRPRMAPEAVRDHIAKHDGDTVARNMIVFAKGGAVWSLQPVPFFAPPLDASIVAGDPRALANKKTFEACFYVFAAWVMIMMSLDAKGLIYACLIIASLFAGGRSGALFVEAHELRKAARALDPS